MSLGSGVLQPLVITVMGSMLNNFSGNAFFFQLSPPAISQLIKDNHIDLVAEFHPTIMRFVYFGIAMLFGSYIAQALWVYTSEVLNNVRPFILFLDQ